MNTNAIDAQRRAQLAQKMGAGGVAIIPTAPEQQRNRDRDFPYELDAQLPTLMDGREGAACWSAVK